MNPDAPIRIVTCMAAAGLLFLGASLVRRILRKSRKPRP